MGAASPLPNGCRNIIIIIIIINDYSRFKNKLVCGLTYLRAHFRFFAIYNLKIVFK